MHFVLLPGMDGTGSLFGPLVAELPDKVSVTILRYPVDVSLNWDELLELVRASVPTGKPYHVVAESFFGPIAIRLAAANPPGLLSLVLCASFCSSPLAKGLGWMTRLAKPAVFKFEPPSAFVRRYLADAASPAALVGAIQAAVSKVSPVVMSNRVQLVHRSNVAAELESVKLPILYLQASRDRIVGDRGWTQIQTTQPTALHVELEGPHLLLQCAPQEASAATLDFVIRNEPPR